MQDYFMREHIVENEFWKMSFGKNEIQTNEFINFSNSELLSDGRNNVLISLMTIRKAFKI